MKAVSLGSTLHVRSGVGCGTVQADSFLRMIPAQQVARQTAARPLAERLTTTRAFRRLFATPDRRAITFLVALPMLIVVPFTLAGHPLLQGDNLTQNYPLRVLTGELMRSGRLPAWDPLIWSGTPLLAGWNAGAGSPFTWLFAILPNLAAWTLNQLVAPIAASLGLYLFLRNRSCTPPGALAGGLAFAWTGFMSGQVVHLGLVEGASMLPWSLLALDAIDRRLEAGSPLSAVAGPVAGLAASLALTVLAGDPRAVSSAAVVLPVYVLALVARAPRRAGRLLPLAVGGAVLGGLCSALQSAPGLRFLASSQRGQEAYTFFSAGSLHIGPVLMLLALPFADGGNGNFGLPVYGGTYNLPEVTIGVGIVALVACFAFLPALATAGCGLVARLRHRRSGTALARRPARRPLGVWYALVVVGLLLTLGTTTPLGHLLVHVPLFGGERLQNRNAEILDLGLVVLLAYFVDDLFSVRDAQPGVDNVLASGTARRTALVPLVAVTGFLIFSLADSSAAQSLYHGSVHPDLWLRNAPYFAYELVVLCGAALLVLGVRRLDRRRYRIVATVTLVLDLGMFLLGASYATAPVSVLGGVTAQSTTMRALSGVDGRFAFYDPLHLNPSPDPSALLELGIPDLNIVEDNPSVEGYGSIVDSTYAAATSTHLYEDLSPSRLSGETFNTLDLTAFMTAPYYLYEPLAPGAPVPLATGVGVGRDGRITRGSAVPSLPTGSSGPFTLAARSGRTLVVGAPHLLTSAEVIVDPLAPHRPGRVSISFIDSAGHATVPVSVPVRHGKARLPAPHNVAAVAIRVANPSRAPAVIGAVVAHQANGAPRLVLDGQLQGDLQPPHWRWYAEVGPFVVYRNTESEGLAWLQPPSKHTPNTRVRAPGSVKVDLSSLSEPSKMVVDSPRPALLVRSETYEPGWTARITPVGGGATRVLTVHRFGLVQVVDLPEGQWEVSWRYAPASLLEGLFGSAAGALCCLALAVVWYRRRRRRAFP